MEFDSMMGILSASFMKLSSGAFPRRLRIPLEKLAQERRN